ncbi:MAG TPA: hypothetical protein DCS05_02620 [Nitrospiraceae bacterium]|nr:hypothetical protein [Nitrospiraceae bacterium]
MVKERALTIDGASTKANIRKDGRTVGSYARLRGFAEGTLYRILDGTYPHNDNPTTVYQQVLMSLRKDGYLVLRSEESEAA